jgi:hypothetical protein
MGGDPPEIKVDHPVKDLDLTLFQLQELVGAQEPQIGMTHWQM